MVRSSLCIPGSLRCGRASTRLLWLSASMVMLALLMLPAPALAFSGIPAAPTHDAALRVVVGLVSVGQFHAANARIDAALKRPGLPESTRTALNFQRERMRRIRQDFNLSAAQVKAQVRTRIPGLTDAQFDRFDAHGFIEHMAIDGKRVYFDRSASGLFHLSAEARALRTTPWTSTSSGFPRKVIEKMADYDRRIIDAASASGHSSVLGQRVKVTQTVTVDADAVPAGKTVRAWIPYPRAIDGQQEHIQFVDSQPATHRVAPKSALQRTVYLKKKAEAGKPTVFSVTYELTLYAQYHAIDPDKVLKAKITPELAPYVAERSPHVVFSQPLRVFSHQIVGDASNPYRIAQRIYAAVDAIPWAGAREYSTIADLSAYTLRVGHGDCGEQTMLLITLMRMNGIPARWQSGWTFTGGGYNNIHDWAEIYLAPYGWVPVDVTAGRLDSSDPGLKWFYLGGLDNDRIAFNDAFSTPFVPAKHSFRSDDVDSQRGEVEWDGGNLYYDQWSYHFDWKVLSSPQKRDPAS